MSRGKVKKDYYSFLDMGIIHMYKGDMTYAEYEELRDKAKVTNYRVAKDLRLGLAFFYKWRTGGINPREGTLKKVTEYLNKGTKHG